MVHVPLAEFAGKLLKIVADNKWQDAIQVFIVQKAKKKFVNWFRSKKQTFLNSSNKICTYNDEWNCYSFAVMLRMTRYGLASPYCLGKAISMKWQKKHLHVSICITKQVIFGMWGYVHKIKYLSLEHEHNKNSLQSLLKKKSNINACFFVLGQHSAKVTVIIAA